MNLKLWSILTWLIAGVILYGTMDFCFDKAKQFASLQADNATLKNKVYWLRQANDYIPALEQFLTPLALDELGLLNEKIRQERSKNHEMSKMQNR